MTLFDLWLTHGTFPVVIAMDDINPAIPGCFPDDGNNVVFVSFTVLMGYETSA